MNKWWCFLNEQGKDFLQQLCRYAQLIFLMIVLAKSAVAQTDRTIVDCGQPRDVVFIIDQSGSMWKNDPDKLRWEIIRYAASLLDTTAPNVDRIAIIPFGGLSETPNYVKASYPAKVAPHWYDLGNSTDLHTFWNLFYQRGLPSRRQATQPKLTRHLTQKSGKQSDVSITNLKLSDTTNIYSAFDYFANYFYPQARNDLFVFFISDGQVDLCEPDCPNENNLIAQHNEELMNLLGARGDRWRLYNICLGAEADVDFHKKMLNCIKVVHRHSGVLYPDFEESAANYPFLLIANDPNQTNNLIKMKNGLNDALSHGISLEWSGKINGNIVSIPGRGSSALRLSFTVKPFIDANVFKSTLFVNFVIDKIPHPAELISLRGLEDHGLISFLEFEVNIKQVADELKKIKKTLRDIDEWQISEQGLGKAYQVLNLEVFYENGWHLIIDTLKAEPDIAPNRSLFRRLFHLPEPCKPILYAHARAFNECGQPLADSTAFLEIVNGQTYPLNVRKTKTGRNGIGDEFEWWIEPIQNDPYLADKLGQTVTVRVSLVGSRYIFQTSTLYIPVCAKYPE